MSFTSLASAFSLSLFCWANSWANFVESEYRCTAKLFFTPSQISISMLNRSSPSSSIGGLATLGVTVLSLRVSILEVPLGVDGTDFRDTSSAWAFCCCCCCCGVKELTDTVVDNECWIELEDRGGTDAEDDSLVASDADNDNCLLSSAAISFSFHFFKPKVLAKFLASFRTSSPLRTTIVPLLPYPNSTIIFSIGWLSTLFLLEALVVFDGCSILST